MMGLVMAAPVVTTTKKNEDTSDSSTKDSGASVAECSELEFSHLVAFHVLIRVRLPPL